MDTNKHEFRQNAEKPKPVKGGITAGEQDVEQMSEQLHVWYLEGTRELDPANYNPKAQKSYAELNEQQKEIDRYIARKVLAQLQAKDDYIAEIRTITYADLERDLAAAQAAMKSLPERLLEHERSNPAWSKSELWGIERDILPAIRLLLPSDTAALAGGEIPFLK